MQSEIADIIFAAPASALEDDVPVTEAAISIRLHNARNTPKKLKSW